jgi:poly-gamma-glutamate capsule biosynthesis protein CapA/YwtB (metallophosphatase superfamily)
MICVNAGLLRPAFAVSQNQQKSGSPSSSQKTLTFAMVGDVMMGTTFPTERLPINDGANLFRDAKKVLLNADVAMGNLEGPLCVFGETTKEGENSYAFRTPPSYARRLKEAGFDFMSLANNHSFDFGEDGILQTEQALDSQGILYAGIEGRVTSVVLELKGIRIGLCAFGHNPYTVNHLYLNRVKQVLNDLKWKSDIIVVSFHGGAEGHKMRHLPYGQEIFLEENRGSLRELAHFCVDNGADIVYGHGPHVLRCVEVYKQKFIAYSLGNFCTPFGVNIKGISGYAPLLEIQTDINGNFLQGQIHPFIQRYGIGPRTDKTGAVIREMKTLTESDILMNAVSIDWKGRIRLK